MLQAQEQNAFKLAIVARKTTVLKQWTNVKRFQTLVITKYYVSELSSSRPGNIKHVGSKALSSMRSSTFTLQWVQHKIPHLWPLRSCVYNKLHFKSSRWRFQFHGCLHLRRPKNIKTKHTDSSAKAVNKNVRIFGKPYWCCYLASLWSSSTQATILPSQPGTMAPSKKTCSHTHTHKRTVWCTCTRWTALDFTHTVLQSLLFGLPLLSQYRIQGPTP